MYGCKAVDDIKKDFLDTFKVSKDVTDNYHEDRNTLSRRIGYSLLRLFAPLL